MHNLPKRGGCQETPEVSADKAAEIAHRICEDHARYDHNEQEYADCDCEGEIAKVLRAALAAGRNEALEKAVTKLEEIADGGYGISMDRTVSAIRALKEKP